MAGMAFARRERCGCVVAVCIEDDALHYVSTLASWQRGRLVIERMTVDQARDEMGKTCARIDALKAAGRKRAGHGLKPCRPLPGEGAAGVGNDLRGADEV